MADITNLTGYTWKANDELNFTFLTTTYNLNFISNNNTFTRFRFENILEEEIYDALFYDDTSIFDSAHKVWKEEAYKTIQITGGDTVTDSFLISWFQNNGTLTKEETKTKKLKLGSKDVKMCLGDSEVNKIYLGEKLLYEK